MYSWTVQDDRGFCSAPHYDGKAAWRLARLKANTEGRPFHVVAHHDDPAVLDFQIVATINPVN